jgi:hypothetical protein
MPGKESSGFESPGAHNQPVPKETDAVHEPRRLNTASPEPRLAEKIVVGASG